MNMPTQHDILAISSVPSSEYKRFQVSVVDPGFPLGGVHPLGGRGPPTWALFSENVCENERIGSHRGTCTRHAPLDPPMSVFIKITYFLSCD